MTHVQSIGMGRADSMEGRTIKKEPQDKSLWLEYPSQ